MTKPKAPLVSPVPPFTPSPVHFPPPLTGRGAGSFNKAVTEGVVKWRPLRTVARPAGAAAQQPSIRHDLIELRFGFVYQGDFEAGQFGPGTPALDGDFSKVLVLAFNLVR